MKRRIALALTLLGTLGASGCGNPPEEATPAAAEGDGWIMPPAIDAVASGPGVVIVSGSAPPSGRVVLSGPGGLTYAAGADAAGRFELRVPRPAKDALFMVVARVGRLDYPAPYRLLIGTDREAPVALLATGGATRRLDPGPALDAVDSDGRAVLLSGRAAAESTVEIISGDARSATTGPDGRWTLASGGGRGPLRVGGQTFVPPPAAGSDGVLERTPEGWQIAWTAPGGGRQWTWFPERSPVGR